MEKTIETKYGEVTLRDIVKDVDGTNLEDAVEVTLDGEVIAELMGGTFDDDITAGETEELIKDYV